MDEQAATESLSRGRNPNKLADMGATAAREKTWDECGIEEKVERLRISLIRARETAQYATRNAVEARDLAERHQHNPTTGEVLRSAQRHGGVESAGSSYDPLR